MCSLADLLLVGRPETCESLPAPVDGVADRHTRGIDAQADLLLVLVREGRVDVAVAGAQGVLDGGLHVVGLGLPASLSYPPR